MTTSKTHLVRIDGKRSAKPLSRAQKQFNTLSKKVDKLRTRLREWQNEFSLYHQKNLLEYNKLSETYNLHRMEFLQLLDRAFDSKAFKKHEKNKLKDIITNICDELMGEQPTDAVRALHDKYSDFSVEEKNQAATEMMRSMAEDLFGLDIDDDVDIHSPEDLFAHLDGKLREEEERLQQQKETRGRRKPTAKQLDKEARQKAEQQQVHKSLQTVYRKLAADLHPDREPDAAERERKTELMQRANIAYNKKDLLQLLELQLEIEQIDPEHINAISDQHLQHYIKILKEQCRELEQAIGDELLRYGPEFAMSFMHGTPKQAMSEMAQDLVDLRHRLEVLQADLPSLQDLAQLKNWLRDYRIRSEPDLDAFMDLAMMDELDDWFEPDDDFFDIPKPKPKRAKKKKAKKRKKTKAR